MPEISLFVLGAPRLEHEGRAVELERHKALALLAYLAVTGVPHRRDELATLLWSELDQTRARAALRRTLSHLNVSIAGDWLEANRETIGLSRSAAFRLDANQFRQLLAQCQKHGHPESNPCPDCLPLLAEAVTLYRADFLSGFTLRDAPTFDDWQFFEAEALRRELASALERLARGYGVRGEFETAILYARRWLALDSLHEPAHRQLMRLYAWADQSNAALRQYVECVRLLDRELGVPPEAATTELYNAIKENRPSPSTDHLPSHPPDDRPASAEKVRAPLEDLQQATVTPPTPAAAYSTLDRIAPSQLIGRTRELNEAATLWNRASSGEGQTLLVSGEPGIGKTRLVRELISLAQTSGGRVLADGCHAEGGPPYAPLASLIRESLEHSSSPDVPDFILADLLTLAPHLRPRYPQVLLNPTLDPHFEQQRIFDSFVTWCESLAATGPLLMLVEDVHWADGGTLNLLRHLARRVPKARLLLVITYRDTEIALDQSHPLHAILLDLNRERFTEHLQLTRLNREQTGNLLSNMLSTPGDITPEFLSGIYEETEGNPFFIEEVCKGLIEQGKLYHTGGTWRRADMQTIIIPQSVRRAILTRIEHLPDKAQDILRLASILGREFDFEILRAASEQDEETLVTALEQAERAQLISEATRAGHLGYTFAHALIPFTLRESLNGLRRQRFHHHVGAAIETQRASDFEALAYHFTAAGERVKAIEYSRRAAERAQTLYAYDTAIQHLETALDLIEAHEQNDTRLNLMESLADVHSLHGEHTLAIEIYQKALELWHRMLNADKWRAVRLHRKIGETFNRLTKEAEIERFKTIVLSGLEGARKLIENEPPHPESARLLTTLANYGYWSSYQHHYEQTDDLSDRGEHYARAAVSLAEQLDAPVELSAALEALANIYSTRGLLRERMQIALRRLDLSRDPHFADQREQISVLYQASTALCSVGDYVRALIHLREAERLADAIHDVGQLISTLNLQIQCHFGLDQWDEILQIEDKRLVSEARYGSERVGRMCFQCGVSAFVHGWRGEAELARSHREEAYQMMAGGWGPLENWPAIGHY